MKQQVFLKTIESINLTSERQNAYVDILLQIEN